MQQIGQNYEVPEVAPQNIIIPPLETNPSVPQSEITPPGDEIMSGHAWHISASGANQQAIEAGPQAVSSVMAEEVGHAAVLREVTMHGVREISTMHPSGEEHISEDALMPAGPAASVHRDMFRRARPL